MLGIVVAMGLIATIAMDAVKKGSSEYKGQICLAVVCAWMFASTLCGFHARNDMEAYLYLNSIVAEETDLLNSANKGPLDDTPEIQALSGRLVAHIQKLNEYAPKAEGLAKDLLFKVVCPDLVKQYWESPTFSYELKAEAVQ